MDPIVIRSWKFNVELAGDQNLTIVKKFRILCEDAFLS